MSNWQKSTHSNATGNCVELRKGPSFVHMRDSKDPNGPVLNFLPEEVDAFIRGAKAGEFDQYILPDDPSELTPEESLAKAEDAENREQERERERETVGEYALRITGANDAEVKR